MDDFLPAGNALLVRQIDRTGTQQVLLVILFNYTVIESNVRKKLYCFVPVYKRHIHVLRLRGTLKLKCLATAVVLN